MRSPLQLFRKYFLVLSVAVGAPLAASGLSEAYFGYRDQRVRLDQLLAVEARSAVAQIVSFLDGITSQLGWLVRASVERGARRAATHRFFAPAAPGTGNCEPYARRWLGTGTPFRIPVGLNRTEARTDRSGDAAVLGARSSRVWYGGVEYYRGSEPYLTVAISGNRPSVGIVVAEVNLKLIWDVVSAIKVGKTGHAFVLDRPGRLIAHPDISLVLRGGRDDVGSVPGHPGDAGEDRRRRGDRP